MYLEIRKNREIQVSRRILLHRFLGFYVLLYFSISILGMFFEEEIQVKSPLIRFYNDTYLVNFLF